LTLTVPFHPVTFHRTKKLARVSHSTVKLKLIWLLVLLFIPIAQTNAFTVWFGVSEQFRDLTPVKLKGPDGQDLILGWKSSRYVLVFGLWARNDGYVLRNERDPSQYFFMPSPSETGRLQQAGILPRPLPPGGMTWFDYAIGYSLWLVIAFSAGGMALLDRWKACHAPKLPPVLPGPPPASG